MTYIKYFTTIVFVFVSFICCFGQHITINTQADADAFNPNTSTTPGSIFINGFDDIDPITNLDNLSNLTSIGGDLEIKYNTALTNINSLSNLIHIEGDLDIRDNASLENIDGFSNLTTLNLNLLIRDNPSLVNIDGLSSLNSMGNYIFIDNNDALTSINGLSNLNSFDRTFVIQRNDGLTNIDGLSYLNSIGGRLHIGSNTSLANIDGLVNITSISDRLNIGGNTSLVNIDGLVNLTSIGGNLTINSNDSLENIDGLLNLTSVGGNLDINNHISLTNIDGLSNLTSLGGYLDILNNDALINIDGLSGLTSIPDDLSIRYNNVLTNIDGLSNITSIGEALVVIFNGDLTDCCGIQKLLNTPGAISGNISINDNPFRCSSENAILNSPFCGPSIKIFHDINQDCIDDNNETGVTNRQFIIQPGDIIGETNTSGLWYLDTLPTGNYTVTIDTFGSWSPTCSVTQSFTIIDPFNESILPAFGLVSTEPCTSPGINIHMPFMRPCFQEQKIYVHACNTHHATGVLENAFVIIELDSLLTPTSSSISYTDLGDHMYQFDIGTLNPGICADFWIETTLSCDAELGQGLCMEANLFPAEDCVFDSIPNPFPPNIEDCNTIWDMSSLSVNGYCENDSIFFEIINSGSGDMTCFSPVRIYINGDLITLDSIQLASGEIGTFSFLGDAQSWRLETNQHPLHPGNSQPNAMVEACGGAIPNNLSFVNAMSLDDADPVIDIYCGIVTGSYDPNDKTGFPLGVNESNDILPNQKIEYLIRFQNTGTDTAFTVVIRDTLSTDFDLFSVQSGVASHAYDFTINDSRAMEWTFNNILLPDSTTNEAGSHGFIKFTVNQIPNLSEGTILENTAAIYFDFNDPIITNTSQHTINNFVDNFTSTNIFEAIIVKDNTFVTSVNIHPNPTNNHVFVHLGKEYQATSFTLRNILGQTILEQSINTSSEFDFEIKGTAGLYLLEIETNSGHNATFKILKN